MSTRGSPAVDGKIEDGLGDGIHERNTKLE
jgi:broad specificity phosphatase PhoE